MEIEIKLKIKDQELILSQSEANELYNLLANMFEQKTITPSLIPFPKFI